MKQETKREIRVILSSSEHKVSQLYFVYRLAKPHKLLNYNIRYILLDFTFVYKEGKLALKINDKKVV